MLTAFITSTEIWIYFAYPSNIKLREHSDNELMYCSAKPSNVKDCSQDFFQAKRGLNNILVNHFIVADSLFANSSKLVPHAVHSRMSRQL